VSSENAEILAKLQQIEDRLNQIEREEQPRTLGDLINRLVPRDVRQHLRAARREQLLAAQAYLGHIIARMDEAGRADEGRSRRRIDVQ
jgi:hypothetical protein